MLRRLYVKDVAIIESAEIEFDGGLTIITGETGAGKSLFVDSIELALGARADSTLVRTGSQKAFVQMLVDPPADPLLQSAMEDLGAEETDELLIERELSADGRSTAKINGRIVTVGQLRSIGRLLVDLHGQHQHQSLLDQDRQLQFLDSWIGEEADALRGEVAELHQERQSLAARVRTLLEDSKERERQIDILEFQVEEIKSAEVREGEFQQAESDLQRAMHRARLTELIQQALDALDGEEGGALTAAHQVVRNLESASEFDSSLKDATETARTASIELQEVRSSLSTYLSNLDADDAALEHLAERIDTLKSLFRKYGDSEREVLDFLAESESRLNDLKSTDQSAPELEKRLQQLEDRLQIKAAELSKLRSTAADQFSVHAVLVLQELAMEGAQLSVQFSSKPVDETGFDSIEFLFTANKGENLKPLRKIASGGELSRVMLAVKSVSSAKEGVPTLVFDEVDAGLSGKAAAKVGAALQSLSDSKQVIVITHLPQIACRAGGHFSISKHESAEGRSITEIQPLDSEGRVVEVARLLAGDDLSDVAIENARTLLQSAATT